MLKASAIAAQRAVAQTLLPVLANDDALWLDLRRVIATMPLSKPKSSFPLN